MRLHTSEEMISAESLDINLNRTLLLAAGLWPYQQSKLVQLQFALQFTILATFIVFQFAIFMTSKCNTDVIINVFASVLGYTTFLVKYCGCKFNIGTIKYSLEQLQHVYDELQDKNEIIMIRKYRSNAKYLTVILILSAILTVCIQILYPFWPRILDIFLPIEKSRSHPPPLFVTEYFIDQGRYSYLIIFHANAAYCIGSIVALSGSTITLVILKYIMAMLQIASYRIEHAITSNNMKRHKENENLVYKRLIYAVDIQRRAIKLCTTFTSKFVITFFCILICGMICSALNLFILVQEISTGRDIGKIILSVILILLYFSYLFIGSTLGQEITDHNNKIFTTAYNIRWYTTPLYTQKMILFMLQIGSKPFILNIYGGLFQGSLETCLSTLSTIMSYFTVLYSVHHW